MFENSYKTITLIDTCKKKNEQLHNAIKKKVQLEAVIKEKN